MSKTATKDDGVDLSAVDALADDPEVRHFYRRLARSLARSYDRAQAATAQTQPPVEAAGRAEAKAQAQLERAKRALAEAVEHRRAVQAAHEKAMTKWEGIGSMLRCYSGVARAIGIPLDEVQDDDDRPVTLPQYSVVWRQMGYELRGMSERTYPLKVIDQCEACRQGDVPVGLIKAAVIGHRDWLEARRAERALYQHEKDALSDLTAGLSQLSTWMETT